MCELSDKSDILHKKVVQFDTQEAAVPSWHIGHAEYMKTMQYVKLLGRIEVCDTLLRVRLITSTSLLGRPCTVRYSIGLASSQR